MAPKSLFAVLLTAATLVGCSAGGGPPSATAPFASQSAGPTTTPEPSAEPSAADSPSLVPCPSGGTPESPITLSEEEALACDLASAAEGSGATLEEEYARYRIGEILDDITSQLSEHRPDVFIGAALSDEPNGAPTIFIKGPADASIRDLIAAAEIEIEIADNQPYSARELDDRQMRLVKALMEVGYNNWAGGSDIKTGRLYASITIEPDLPSTVPELLERLPADLRSGVDIEFSETPVAVDTIPE